MKRSHDRAVLGILVAGSAVAAAFAGCSASSRMTSTSSTGGSSTSTSTGFGGGGGAGGSDGGVILGDSGPNCPSTCAALGANCGAVTDTICGGVVMCGDCPTGQTCGGTGTHNVCGVGNNPDACSPMTCQQQGITCGPAGDGCNGTLNCGTCTLPQSCGGDPSKPGQCGCTGTCAMVPTCTGMTTTTLTGKVYDPGAVHPLYNALVYIPNNPSDPGLQPFQPGISCDQCGATAAGNPLVSTQTAPDGTFTLTGVPVGGSIPLVVQLGHWRRQFTVNVANSCAANSVPDKTLTMPKTHAEGDIPFIAVLTGGLDPVECTLRKMGVADSEFTNPGGGGHINFYTALDTNAPNPTVQGHGSTINAQTPAQSSLFATMNNMPVINQYDMVILECEGYGQTESASDRAALVAYANAGGRIFGSDFVAESWFQGNGTFMGAANWSTPQNGGVTAAPVTIDLVNNPKGMAFDKWLEIIGVSVAGSDTIASMYPAFENTTGVISPTQRWLWYGNQAAMHFTFNTPVGAPSQNQCGRAVFSDWHAQQPTFSPPPKAETFPAECDSTPMTSQQAVLEFMLFDLSACVMPYTPVCTPKTCMDENIDCGPAGDGCGGLLDCGKCPMGQFCGGSGPGKCGNSSNCMPTTCSAQGIQCGPAGDGCGNPLDCGNCPTGQICGLGGPGKCGKVQ